MVYAKPPVAGPKQVLEYLGCYTHRVAISNNRLLGIDDGSAGGCDMPRPLLLLQVIAAPVVEHELYERTRRGDSTVGRGGAREARASNL